MANKDDYLTSYREFFEYFAQTVNPNDQLPVKLASYKLLNVEVVGGIIDWTTQYLTQKKCPPHLFSPLIKIIIEEIRKSCKKQPLNYGFNSTDNAYEPLKLMQAVMAKTNEVCLRYLDNSVLCSLPTPSNTYYETSVYAVRNRRRKMEDRHVVIHDLNTIFNIQEASPSSYYAIFDGHAGHDAAAYSSAHLHQYLAENKYFMSNPEQALLDAFCKTDALFLEKCKVESLSGGTTAVVALLRPKEKTLYIAWVGDSQALLVKQGKILQCVNPHKPCREDERERIETSGGCVMLWGTWRVNGQLAVSRAIGDADYKPHVIAIPDVREFSLDGNEDFLIIACDGLWDYLSEDAAAQEVYYMIAENPDDTERISKHLTQLARYQGSTDNISVIVVFLRETHKIAAEAHLWATRNGPPLNADNMETSLDNANNPFTNSNGSLKNLDVETDNIHLQKSGDGLLLNLTDNFKANGTDLSQDIFEKSNGTKKSSSDIHFDDELGPETDVDAVDDAFSPVEKNKAFADNFSKGFNDGGLPKSFNDEVKAFSEELANNNPLDNTFNPFLNKEIEESSKAETKDDFEEHGGDNREETPTPPVDTVHDVGGLEENPAESDSEDEWNYFKGDQEKPAALSLQPETVVETSEQEDAMSQLNPNAAEFVPVSPTRSIPSPVCRALLNDEVIAQSPKRPIQVDIKVPNETEFETEVKSRPSDFDAYSNGHDSDSEHNISGTEQIESILNGKSIDEIPEFQPVSTPTKQLPMDEFHFGPNAAPFTPKPLDQSEAFSTKANYGDDTEQTLNTSFNDSELAIPPKDLGDPMSMSFSAERGESNPFQDNDDLNKVHDLPENLDEFLEKDGAADNKENRILDDTISDLPEHDVLGHLVDNDQAAIQTTDLDKISQDDEKELASPLDPDQEDDLFDVQRNIDVPLKTPDSNLLEGFVVVPEKPTTDDSNTSLPELESVSPLPEPQPELRESREVNLLAQCESVSPPPVPSADFSESRSPLPEEAGLVQPAASVVDALLTEATSDHMEQELMHAPQDLIQVDESQGPVCEFRSETKSPLDDFEVSKSPVCELKPASDKLETEFNPKSDVDNIPLESRSPGFPEESGASPILACEYSAEPAVCELQQQSVEATIPESYSPFEQQKHEEEITSSVKDDISSPIELLSPVKSPEHLLDESLEQEVKQIDEEAAKVIDASFETFSLQHNEDSAPQTEDVPRTEVPPQMEPSQDFVSDLISTSQPPAESEPLVEKIETNLIEASAPLEPTNFSELANGLDNFASQVNEQFSIKTDSIQPEFAEPTIITPSEDSKVIDDVLVAPQSEVPVQEPLHSEIAPTEPLLSELKETEQPQSEQLQSEIKPAESSQETPKELPALAPLPIIPVLPGEVKEVKKEEKKSSAASSAKKPTGKVTASRFSTTPKAAAAKPSPKPAAGSPKTGVSPRVPSKTGPPKPAMTASKTTTSSAPAAKPLPKPKTATAPKPTERKPLSNGDVKPLPRTTLTKKPAAEAAATKMTSRPATAATKTSPTKTTAPRPATAPRTTLSKTTASTTAPKPASSTTTAPKPRVPLTSKSTTATSAASSRLTSTTTKTTTTTGTTNRTSPAAKPRTVTYTAPKPRVPLTKTVTKSADVEKEKKESANKLTASRTSTVTKTTSATATSRTATTTVKKTETKPLSHRTAVSKTTTTTTKTTTSRKPGEVKSVTKTKTTKVEKPKENGVAPTNVTEEIKEITIVNNVVNDTENLLKDNSPLDNKLITETTNSLIDVNPAD